jgi:hypothetical protein
LKLKRSDKKVGTHVYFFPLQINSTIRSKPFDYLIIQDVHGFIHVDKLIKDLDYNTEIVDQLGNDEKGLVISWNRYQELLIHPADVSTGSTVANVKQVWKNSIESTNTSNLIITDVYQDQDFLDLVSLYQLQPIISKTSTAKSIAVVTSSYIYDYCMEPSGTKASLNKRSYADKHGYAFVARSKEFAQQAMRPDQRRTVWGKIDVIQKVLPKYDWVFWLDMDAVVMNSEQTIEDLFERVEINDQTHFIIVRPGTDKMINAGVFLIRNTPWSFQFLDEIQNQTEWYRQGPSYEQGAMWDIMRREEFIQHTKFLDRENHLFNTFPKFYQQNDFIVHFAPDKCPNSATLKGLAAADSIEKGHVVTSQDLL